MIPLYPASQIEDRFAMPGNKKAFSVGIDAAHINPILSRNGQFHPLPLRL